MKKILFSICLIAASFCSCSNNDNEPEVEIPKNPLIGSWEMTYMEGIYGIGDDIEIDKSEYIYAGESDYFSNLIIKENGTLTAIDFVKQNGTPSYYDAKYIQGENSITIIVDYDGEEWISEFNIEKLTDDELVISVVEDEDFTSKYYYKKKEFVEKSIQELILGEWDFKHYYFYVDGKNVDSGNDYGETITHLSISNSTFVMTIDNDTDDVEAYFYTVKDHIITLYEQHSVFLNLTIDYLDSESMDLEMPYYSNEFGEGMVTLSFDKK